MKYQYNKLVRDKIPNEIDKNNSLLEQKQRKF